MNTKEKRLRACINAVKSTHAKTWDDKVEAVGKLVGHPKMTVYHWLSANRDIPDNTLELLEYKIDSQ